jgi:uncharacterized protein (DUF885 family)
MHKPSLFSSLPLCAAIVCLSASASQAVQTSATANRAEPAKAPRTLPAVASASTRLSNLAQRFYETEAQFDPIKSTFNGDKRHDDQLPMTLLPKVREQHRKFLLDTQKQLNAIPRAKEGSADQTTWDCLAWVLQNKLALNAFPEHLLPMSHIGSLPVLLATFASGNSVQALKTPEQYDIFLRRLEQLPIWSELAIKNMREGIKQHIVMPRALIESTLPQLKVLVADPPENHPYYAPIKNFPADFSEAEQTRLRLAYSTRISQHILPALRRLNDFMREEYLIASRDSTGLHGLPNGANWYRAKVKSSTNTDLTPQQIHTIGLQEVARIQAEFVKLGPQLGYEGPARDLPSWISKQEKFFPFKSEAGILAAYHVLNEKVKPQLPRLFSIIPKAGLEIREVPAISRATAANQYTAPAQDGSRPGVFWAVINKPEEYATTGMTTLLLHEGQPGHHFHMALARELPLPRFRQTERNSAFGEGWALYAETLGHEMGLYENDPNAYLGHLTGELLRAARLVVDTGLHAKGWTREQTITYLQDTLGYNLAAARQATERYMGWPGQALAYTIGALKFKALRHQATSALGPKFDLRAFHDAILSDGTLPLPLLEAKMARWIKAQQAL